MDLKAAAEIAIANGFAQFGKKTQATIKNTAGNLNSSTQKNERHTLQLLEDFGLD